MFDAIRAPDETQRLAALFATGLLQSPPDDRFDRLARMAAQTLKAQTAIIHLVDETRVERKAHYGLLLLSTPDSRNDSLCSIVVGTGEPLLVADTLRDERFYDNPWVTGDAHLRFYAGAPIHAPNGAAIGTLCLMGDEPRSMLDSEARLLCDFAALVDSEIAHSATRGSFQALSLQLAECSKLAATDAATGLWNRPAIIEILRSELARSLRGEPTSVAFIGIDRLSEINSSSGRLAGDALIAGVSSCIRHCIRDFDSVGREGGDTFILTLSNCDRLPSRIVSERVRQFIFKQRFQSPMGPLKTSVSIGVATSVSGPLSLERVLSAAERSMISAKALGRNRLVSDPSHY